MSFATTTWPDNGGYHTERKYCLYYMRRSYFAPMLSAPDMPWLSNKPLARADMVEAPGTAPGSALLILQHVYRHSWLTSKFNIEAMTPVLKDSFALNCL